MAGIPASRVWGSGAAFPVWDMPVIWQLKIDRKADADHRVFARLTCHAVLSAVTGYLRPFLFFYSEFQVFPSTPNFVLLSASLRREPPITTNFECSLSLVHLGTGPGLNTGALLASTMIQGLIVLNYPTYIYKVWYGTLLMITMGLFSVFSDALLARRLPVIEGLVLILHIGVFSV